jgi:hypothetical protein
MPERKSNCLGLLVALDLIGLLLDLTSPLLKGKVILHCMR